MKQKKLEAKVLALHSNNNLYYHSAIGLEERVSLAPGFKNSFPRSLQDLINFGMFAEDNLSLVKFVCFTIKLSSLNYSVYNILEWTSWELSDKLSMCYNLIIWVDYYNYRIIGGDFYGYHER